jgi:exopolyphosphatase/guanosine-5'-triphosphate,3'-diphosphate pyrophosphatase
MVGCIARYHRRAAPSPKHESFGSLRPEDQRKVRQLSAILRIADSLDRGHRSKVQKLEIASNAKDVLIKAHGREDLSLEVWTAEKKADYFTEMFDRTLKLRSETE